MRCGVCPCVFLGWQSYAHFSMNIFPISILGKHFHLCSCGYAVYFPIEVLTQFRQWVRMFYLYRSRVVTLSAVWLLQRMFQTHLHQQSPGAVRPVLQADCLAPAERRRRQQRGGRERSSSSYLSPSVSSRCCWLYSSTLWQLHLRERGRYIKRERGRSINAILDA